MAEKAKIAAFGIPKLLKTLPDGVKYSPTKPVVLEYSRRIDVAGCSVYVQQIVKQLDYGFIHYNNPICGTPVYIDTSNVKLVHWFTKNPQPVLDAFESRPDFFRNYQHIFRFTLNGECATLEPGVPPLADRLQTLYSICHLYPEYGSRVVQISYDPMMLYYDDINDPEHAHPLNNLSRFDDVVHAASKLGIPTIHMSFYQKMGMISGANARRADLSFPVLTPEQQLALLRTHVFPVLHRYKDTVTLNTCTAIPVLGLLSADERKLMTRGFCLSPEYVNQFLDTKLTKLKTCGRPYCGCVDRVDGANKLRGGCVHGCVYCFANSTKGGEPDLECDGGDDLTDIEDLA